MKKDAQSETGSFTAADLVRSIWYFIAEDRKKYVFFSLMLMAALAYEFVPPYLVGTLITFLTDRRGGTSLRPLFLIAAVLVVTSAATAIARLTAKRVLADISINARYRARVWGFERLVALSLSWHQKESTGNKSQRIITGSESIREWSRDLVNSILPALISFTGTIATCLLLSPWFAVFFLYYLGVLVLVETWFDRRILELSDRINASIENASGTFVESATNILSVKALGAGNAVTENVISREETARILAKRRNYLGTTKWKFFQMHNSLSWGLYLVAVGLLVARGTIPAAMLLTYSIYFTNMKTNVTGFVEQFQVMIERRSNLCRMMPFFRTVESTGHGRDDFPSDWDEIAFEDVGFDYGDKRVLRGLTLRIARDSIVGIAGRSGSGKSTIVKLLLGLYENGSGTVRIGGRPVRDIRYEEIAAHVSVVLQETELFNLTLRENITMMRNVDEETFARSCRIACVDAILDRLPAGADTVIGERGLTLSGGERQRIGIARAICRNAEILLLDEATSALDDETERRIIDALASEFSKGRTVIMIAHRTTTLKGADRVVMLEKGRLAGDGTWESIFGG